MKTLLEYFPSPAPGLPSDNSLSEAILNLPDENRVAIDLYFENNLTRKQIASKLGWSVSKVNQKITRGITLLKIKLNPEYFRKADEMMEETAQRLLMR